MRTFLMLLGATASVAALSGCAADYGYSVGASFGTPYAYDGYYDDFYGPIYDGYWGTDGFFYYRRGVQERHFHRGDHAHFRHDHGGDTRFHAMQGTMTPQRGLRTPHYSHDGDRDRRH